ncbi:Asparagine synthetase (glutamine-hydrolyzing) [Tenacibaculum sp. 190524A02b]|uniref:asparagine synthase (glutamine-hydrolyzing) n=1 Tax=Tenacibaculum vairaonense TaxID=3137860 RepID=UPI0032B2AC22
MCGIYMTNLPFKEEEIKSKLNKIKYRGPDYIGVLKKKNISLGHLRLSILDLDERSHQPYVYKHLSLVFNGEIYNFLDVKRELINLGYSFNTTSDTEVLLKGYDAWGQDILNKINGMFAFAILDDDKEEIFCGRDRLGVKPFYYYWKDGSFEICSQLQPLINDKSEISEESISIYLDYGYVPSPFSILKNTYKLEPGKFLVINLKNRTKKINEYWNLKRVKTENIPYEEAKKKLHLLLEDAVKIRMQSDVPLGTFLSGGIDSALVTAIASKISKQKIKTFTIGFEDPSFDESKVAENFSSILGTEHTTTFCKAEDLFNLIPKLVETYDEPFADSSALPSLLLNKITKKHVTVALSGDGGDESFLGYVHFDLLKKYQKISLIPYVIRKVISKLPFHKFIKAKKETFQTLLLSKDVYEFSKSIFFWFDSLQLHKKEKWKKYYNSVFSENPFQFQADYNIKLWLENDSNVKVDRASMAYSMEIRSPFLDYRIVEFSRKLPIHYRYDSGNKKIITKDILEEYLPREAFELPKKGFSIPLGKWISGEMKEEILSSLNDDFLRSVPNLNIKKIKRQLKDHMNGKNDYSFNIWKLYVLNLWLRKNKLKI